MTGLLGKGREGTEKGKEKGVEKGAERGSRERGVRDWSLGTRVVEETETESERLGGRQGPPFIRE